ncbi:homologous recombination OB-fold protein [Bombina bombina]|uniref:homologous recombination OB-fold protein n=1 Tax=Bombina bombina TaxID=8345 RepID=UPI00235B0601|nr:homologous recombination OB-fold protein [Bombina bombina]
MALSFQKLFAAESEDFDDEDFLSLLELPETNVLHPLKANFRHLRPISHNPVGGTSHSNSFSGQKQQITSALDTLKPDRNQNLSNFNHDVDDDELLSICNELEEEKSDEHCKQNARGLAVDSSTLTKTANAMLCLKGISHNQTGIPERERSLDKHLPAFQLRPSRSGWGLGQDPENSTKNSSLKGITGNKHTITLSDEAYTENTLNQQLHPSGEGSCHSQAHGPTAKRPFHTGMLENQPLTPQNGGCNRNITNTLQLHIKDGGGGHCQSAGSTPKRPCFRTISENHPCTPVKEGQHIPYSSTVPGGLSIAHNGTRGNLAQSDNSRTWQHSSPQINNLKGCQSSPHSSTPSALQTPVVTNHLVQLVTAAKQTPRMLSWETPPPKERKFPGPAGLLPHQGNSKGLEEILVSTPSTPTHGACARLSTKEGISNQQSVDEYIRGPWAKLKADFGVDERDPACFLCSYSVVMVLRKAALKQLPKNKVPQMAVALKSLTRANGDASAVFRDPTGDIQGTVHHLLLEERESDLKIGSLLLLKQVGVFSPSHRNHYLNVTPSNLVKIYHPEDAEETDENVVPVPQTPGQNSHQAISTQNRGDTGNPKQTEAEDWDMDELDSLFVDLPEDPGD